MDFRVTRSACEDAVRIGGRVVGFAGVNGDICKCGKTYGNVDLVEPYKVRRYLKNRT